MSSFISWKRNSRRKMSKFQRQTMRFFEPSKSTMKFSWSPSERNFACPKLLVVLREGALLGLGDFEHDVLVHVVHLHHVQHVEVRHRKVFKKPP
jgi:hypothetical protein